MPTLGHDPELDHTDHETFVCPACKRFLAKRERGPITYDGSPNQGESDNVFEQTITTRSQEKLSS